MSGGWISTRLQRVIDSGFGPQVKTLRDAFVNRAPMLAAIVRLDLLGRDPSVKIAFQRYTPRDGRGMHRWGDI